MVPFNLQLEINARQVAIFAEQLDQFADKEGFMRYQISTFHHNAVVFVNVQEEPLLPEDIVGFSEEYDFTPDEVVVIAAAIRQYNDERNLSFDQMTFDF